MPLLFVVLNGHYSTQFSDQRRFNQQPIVCSHWMWLPAFLLAPIPQGPAIRWEQRAHDVVVFSLVHIAAERFPRMAGTAEADDEPTVPIRCGISSGNQVIRLEHCVSAVADIPKNAPTIALDND
jgi:hypothetical protein